MSARNDGGSAFPKTGFFHPDGFAANDSEDREGMSLRDWFAGRFGASAIVNAEGLGEVTVEERKDAFALLATISYELADAFLAARDQTP